jgi:hypothetical protein
MPADKHKKAAVRNMMELESALVALREDVSDEAVARAAGLALSIPTHALLYIGDRLGEVNETLDDIRRKR